MGMHINQGMAWSLLACALLAACENEGLTCRSLAAVVDDAEPSGTCTTTCRSSNVRAAADGDPQTRAVLTLEPGGSSSIGARVKASGNGRFAAGTQVGVIYEASAADQANVSYELNTYLGDMPAETFTLSSDGVGSPAREREHVTHTTRLAYDRVEFLYRRTSGTTAGSATVYELCSD